MSAHRFKATNTSGLNLDFVDIESIPPGHLNLDTELRAVGLGQSFFFGFGGGMTDPASVNIHLTSRDHQTNSMGEFFATIP